MAAKQTDTGQAITLGSCCEGMEMVRMWTAEANKSRRAARKSSGQVIGEFEPLVAGQL